jgi:hypothetical protein
LIYYWIDLKKFWLACFGKVVGIAVLVVVHPPNLGLIKEGLGMMSQPNLWLMGPRGTIHSYCFIGAPQSLFLVKFGVAWSFK